MTETPTQIATPDRLREIRRGLALKAANLHAALDRLMLPNGMTEGEKTKLKRELGASNESALRTRLRQEVGRAEQALDLLGERIPLENAAPDAASIAAQARAEIAALAPLRARLAREVVVDGKAARMGLLEETEERLARLELEAARAELVAAVYPS